MIVITPESFTNPDELEPGPVMKFLQNPSLQMINQTYADIVTPELLTGAIENNEYEGFRADYHVLHCLIRKYKPSSLFEIGTNMGTGTNIIANAGKAWMMKVYSLDLPTELAHVSLQHPISEGKGDKVGSNCKFGYTQLRGDSMTFDYNTVYPIDAWFIDGEHDRDHVFHETYKAKTMDSTRLIIWHDADIPEVWSGIVSWFGASDVYNWDFVRVEGTRIAYAVKKDSTLTGLDSDK